MKKDFTPNPYDDEEWRLIFQKVKTELTTHLAPGETLPDDLEQETWEIHNELNRMAQQMASACIDRFRQLLHGVIGPVTPDHLTELMNEEIALFLPSGFLQPDYCHTTCKERVRARQELSELPVDTDELNVARYALLRKLVENKNGSLLIDKARGICYVYNKWEDLTQKAKKDFVRFGYMLRLINDKLTELENNRVEEAVSEKPKEVQPALVEAEEPSIIKSQEQYEERFHFIHPEIEAEEAWRIHVAVKRLVATQKVPEICVYLKELKIKGKVLLPSASTVMYKELVRMGMPTGDGYSEKYFKNSYLK
jgi:hypothetical protein